MQKQPNLFAYLLHKEPGDTSFAAIRKLQRACGAKKVGHCGTLDRFAEGLLIVLRDEATKLTEILTGLPKSYVAEIEFGRESDTLDPEGRIVREAPIPQEGQIRAALDEWLREIAASNNNNLEVGELWQQPPVFSAIHSGGKRLYQRALAGENLNDVPPRRVALYSCEILGWQSPLLKVRLRCSKGFYVRAFARDLAIRCGSAGHLRSLLRCAVGSLQLEHSQTLAQKPAKQNLIDILRQLQGQLPLELWQTGKDIYPNGTIPEADQIFLRQGRIPGAVLERFENTKKETLQFALIDGKQLLALFCRTEGGRLQFRNNFMGQ